MHVRSVAAVLLVCAGLTACGGGQDESAATLPPVSASESAGPTDLPDSVPSSATAASPEGAAEFAQFFYSEVTRGFHTRNPDLVARLSEPGCATCENYVRSITAIRDEGLRVEGGDFDIAFAVAPGLESPERAVVDVGWSFTPATYYGSDGSVVESGPAVSGVEEQMTLVRSASSWRVAEITRIRQRP